MQFKIQEVKLSCFACKGRAEKSAMESDERAVLAAYLKPWGYRTKIIYDMENEIKKGNIKDDNGQEIPVENGGALLFLMRLLYDSLSSASEKFKAAFPTYRELDVWDETLTDTTNKLMNTRTRAYDESAEQCANALKALLPDIPRHEASTREGLDPFLKFLKANGGALLTASNQASDLLTSVKKDMEAFGMAIGRGNTLCRFFQDRHGLF